MMKNKILIIAAMLAVMLAMTGIAVAITSIAVDHDPLTINVGETGTQTVSVSAPGNILKIKVDGANLDADGEVLSTYDLTTKFTVLIDGNPGVVDSGSWSSPKIFHVAFTNDKNAPNGDYSIQYTATYLDGTTIKKTSKITADINAIPEFPTVALPVAAVIGLVFFFQQKKKNK